ncbi:hypothetical protein V493_02501 [Pseudogymnoascus sp. VKM F-4281 (FW-2241)]|nr:hypothetical protein V493_02501 [Pseudogymnoascus sp. VKM F-4281 (FW-2241)]
MATWAANPIAETRMRSEAREEMVRRPRHLKRILQRRTALRVLRVSAEQRRRQEPQSWTACYSRRVGDMQQTSISAERRPREGGDGHGEPVAHAQDAELGDGVLLEEFGDEGGGVAEGEEVACWAEVFFEHGGGEVED